jgi:ketosteroid isomerase-like protein
MSEVRDFLEQHLASIFAGDSQAYHQTTTEDLTIYEWYVTPQRIDGLPFHDFMLAESADEASATMALDPNPGKSRQGPPKRTRFDLANYKEQLYGDCAVCSYTMLISQATEAGVRVLSYNESRVLAREAGAWRVVHVHKSPAWNAPFQAPEYGA